jgi:hypothetical protein
MSDSEIAQNITRIRNILYRPIQTNGYYTQLLYTYELKKLQAKEREINKLLLELKDDYQQIEYNKEAQVNDNKAKSDK